MNTELQHEILEYILENGSISSQGISEFMDLDKAEVYAFLTECEKNHIVFRTSGKDGETLVFKWSIHPDVLSKQDYDGESSFRV